MKKALIITAVVMVAIQLIPVSIDNPPYDPAAEMAVPQEIKPILQKHCFDCHSNHVVKPWYASIAPISWWIASHVNEGRKALNFSTWRDTPEFIRKERSERMETVIANGRMPLPSYTLMHPPLTAKEKELLRAWARTLKEAPATK
ncbi:MAG: heme-binding domain-containing protein [Campylobacterales bacterium]